jgi:hypothetical protein
MWLSSAVTTPVSLLVALTTRGAGLVYFVIGNVALLAGVLVYNVTITAFRQAYCPPELLGRVVATMRFVLFGTIPLGALAGGALAGAIGPRTAVVVMMAGGLISSAILYASPLRHMRDLPASPAGLAEPAPAAAHT